MAQSEQNFEPGRISVLGCFGGGALRSHPKQARPYSSKYKIQIVIELNQATAGDPSLVKANAVATHVQVRGRESLRLARRLAHHFEGKHVDVSLCRSKLSIVARWPTRARFLNYLRALCGVLARRFLDAERNSPSSKVCFLYRPFTRILEKAFDAWTVGSRLAKLSRGSSKVDRGSSKLGLAPVLKKAAAAQKNLLSKVLHELEVIEQGGPPLWRILAANQISVWVIS